jgi:hypothetical protein
VLAPEAFVARSQRHSRHAALIGLALFVGIAGASSIALIAGARRSSSVVDRFITAAPRYDIGVYSDPGIERSAILTLPGVERADAAGYIAATVVDDSGRVIGPVDGNVTDFTAPADPTLRILDGTLPDGSDPLDIVVNEYFAQNFDVSVGDRVNLKMFAPDQGEAVAQGIYEPAGETYEMTIAAVVRAPDDIAKDDERTTSSRPAGNIMFPSYEFWEQHHTEFLGFGLGYGLVLAEAQDNIRTVTDALPSLARPGDDPPFEVPFEKFAKRAAFDTPVDLETTAVLALGIGIAFISGVTMVLLVRGEQRFHDRDTPGLLALGFTRAQLATVAGFRVLPAAVLASMIAAVGAVALSNRFPIGIGRQMELEPGLQVNVGVIALGALLVVALVVGASMLASGSRTRTGAASTSPFTTTRLLRGAGAPTEVALGAHVAFESQQGRRSTTTIQGVFGGVIALVVVGALAMWLGGVNHLYNEPASHGWPGDAAIGNTNFPLLTATSGRLAADPLIAARTAGLYGQATLGGQSSELFAFDPSGDAPPTIIDGRLPNTPDEVAIGTRVMRRLDVEIGDTIVMSLTDSEFSPGDATPDVELTVVGTALAPMFGESDLGDTSLVTLDAIRMAGGDPSPRLQMVRFAGSDRSAAAAEVDQAITEDLVTDIIPARVVNMHRVRSVPMLGILLAGVLGTITLGYVIVAGARIHRRELAILRALGLEAKPLRRVLAWQGVLTALAMLIIGLPLALVAGNVLWRRVADDTGVSSEVFVPPQLLLLIPATLAVAITASLVANFRVRRTRVADLLREE